MHLHTDAASRWATGFALVAAFLIVWLNAAAGLIGIEDDDPANLLYVGVLAIGLIGAIVARFQPGGMARAMFATGPNSRAPIRRVGERRRGAPPADRARGGEA